jgi:N-acetylglutamate synthase-like GNAT family acetyltransferase
MIEIKLLTKENMKENGLDDFCRTQIVKRQYKLLNGEYILVEAEWVMDWDQKRKCDVAKSLISDDYIAYGAFENDRIIGFVSVESKLRGEHLVLDNIQVSQEYRRDGLGRKLFQIAKERVKVSGAKHLYISACPSEETIHFYKAMGCKIAINPIKDIAEEEPMDVQMVCDIG